MTCVNGRTPRRASGYPTHDRFVDGERPGSMLPVDLHVLLSRAVGGSVTRITVGIAMTTT